MVCLVLSIHMLKEYFVNGIAQVQHGQTLFVRATPLDYDCSVASL